MSNLIFPLTSTEATRRRKGRRADTLYIHDEVGVPVSDTQTVIADRSSSNASERVFHVRFTLKQMQFNRNKIYRLVIANDTDAPDEIEFRIDIAFADDFGFDL